MQMLDLAIGKNTNDTLTYRYFMNEQNETIGKNKRVVFTLNPEIQKREMVGEWHFKDTNISLCQVATTYR